MRRLFAWAWSKFQLLGSARYPAEPVALFRILCSAVLLADVIATWKLSALFWGTWNDSTLIDAAYGAWSVVLVCLILGYRTTVMAVANAIFCYLLIFKINPVFEYHFDYYVRTWALYLVFMQSGRAYSIDSLIARQRAASTGVHPSRTVPLFIVVLFVAQFALDYFDAGYRKWIDPAMWPDGFGLYWPMVVRYCSTGNGLWLLEYDRLLELGSRAAVYLELFFPLLVLWRPTRYVAILGGVVLHIGIIYVFPIPYFGEFMLAIYALFVPIAWIRRLESRLLPWVEPWLERAAKRIRQVPPAPVEDGPPKRSRLAPLRPYVVVVIIAALIVVKLGQIKKGPRIMRLEKTATTLTGFVRHGVFISKHFKKNGILELELELVDGSRVHYPFVRKDGYPDELLRASTRVWAMMSRTSFRHKPRKFLERHFLKWLDATNPKACAAHIFQRWVKPPRRFSGAADVWTKAKRKYHGRYAFRGSKYRKKCQKPAAKAKPAKKAKPAAKAKPAEPKPAEPKSAEPKSAE